MPESNVGPQAAEKSVPAPQGLDWEFSDKPVTAWGGLRLVQEMTARMGLRRALEDSELPARGSNRSFAPAEMLESFMATVWVGGNRFSHTALVRYDEALKEIFGWEQVASVSTFTRFFRRFEREDVDRVFGRLGKWFWEQMAPRTLTLDFDSSVVIRYGEQEGAERGYNPEKKGRTSHHPLFAFVADMRMVLHAWLRPGNTHSNNGASEFYREAVEQLGGRHRVGLVRCDAGFFDGKFLEVLEVERAPYIVACRLTPAMKARIAGLPQWLGVDEGIAVSELAYEAQGWDRARRIIVVRQDEKERPDAMGKVLLQVPGFRYQAYATSLSFGPAEVWRLYRGRADSENRIAELKQDFGMTGFCLDSFYGTEAALRTALFAYNLMSLFRQALLEAPKAVRMSTMRFQCFALGSALGRDGRRRVLRISLARERRPWFRGLFARIQDFQTPWMVPT